MGVFSIPSVNGDIEVTMAGGSSGHLYVGKYLRESDGQEYYLFTSTDITNGTIRIRTKKYPTSETYESNVLSFSLGSRGSYGSTSFRFASVLISENLTGYIDSFAQSLPACDDITYNMSDLCAILLGLVAQPIPIPVRWHGFEDTFNITIK